MVKNGEIEIFENGAYYGKYEIDKSIFDTTTNINTTDEIKAVQLDKQRALIAYRDSSNGSAGTAIIATVKNGKVSYGSKYVFNTNTVGDIGLAVVDEEHTDVKVSINRKPYVVEIATVDNEKDFSVLSKAEYINRYGSEFFED